MIFQCLEVFVSANVFLPILFKEFLQLVSFCFKALTFQVSFRHPSIELHFKISSVKFVTHRLIVDWFSLSFKLLHLTNSFDLLNKQSICLNCQTCYQYPLKMLSPCPHLSFFLLDFKVMTDKKPRLFVLDQGLELIDEKRVKKIKFSEINRTYKFILSQFSSWWWVIKSFSHLTWV